MKKSDFQPTPGFVCKFCDFRLICPVGWEWARRALSFLKNYFTITFHLKKCYFWSSNFSPSGDTVSPGLNLALLFIIFKVLCSPIISNNPMLASPPTSPSPSLPEEQILLDDIRAIGGPLYLFDAVNAAERARIAGVDDDLIVVALSSIGISQAHWQQNLLDRRTAPRVFCFGCSYGRHFSYRVLVQWRSPSPPVSRRTLLLMPMLQQCCRRSIGARNTI